MITDRAASGEVEVGYCPVEHMQANVLNKTKQGMMYRVFRAGLMNMPEVYDDKKERFNTHPDLLDNAKETLDENHPLQELLDKLTEVRSKTHNHHRSVLYKSQFGNK